MRGFKSHQSATRFCRSFDELRNHLHPRSCRTNIPASFRRHRFITLIIIALRIMEAA
jgi:putative transposase